MTTGKKAPPSKSSANKTTPRPDDRQGKKHPREHKVKVVRDSFTMPRDEYQKIAEIKELCLKSKLHVKKSEILRAGLKLLSSMSAAKLKQELAALEKIKTGRPKKH